MVEQYRLRTIDGVLYTEGATPLTDKEQLYVQYLRRSACRLKEVRPNGMVFVYPDIFTALEHELMLLSGIGTVVRIDLKTREILCFRNGAS